MAEGRKDIISWAQLRGRRSAQSDLLRFAHSKVPGLENVASFIRFIFQKRLFILFLVAAVVLLFFFWSYLKVLIVMGIFIALAAMSMLYNKWIKLSIGVELIMLGLVITSVAFGRLPGLVVGIVGLFLAEVISERFTYSTFVSFIGVCVVALIAPNVFNQAGSITSTGIIVTVVYDAIIIPGYLLLGSSFGRSAFFVVTHIFFNIWVFTFLAPAIFRILT